MSANPRIVLYGIDEAPALERRKKYSRSIESVSSVHDAYVSSQRRGVLVLLPNSLAQLMEIAKREFEWSDEEEEEEQVDDEREEKHASLSTANTKSVLAADSSSRPPSSSAASNSRSRSHSGVDSGTIVLRAFLQEGVCKESSFTSQSMRRGGAASHWGGEIRSHTFPLIRDNDVIEVVRTRVNNPTSYELASGDECLTTVSSGEKRTRTGHPVSTTPSKLRVASAPKDSPPMPSLETASGEIRHRQPPNVPNVATNAASAVSVPLDPAQPTMLDDARRQQEVEAQRVQHYQEFLELQIQRQQGIEHQTVQQVIQQVHMQQHAQHISLHHHSVSAVASIPPVPLQSSTSAANSSTNSIPPSHAVTQIDSTIRTQTDKQTSSSSIPVATATPQVPPVSIATSTPATSNSNAQPSANATVSTQGAQSTTTMTGKPPTSTPPSTVTPASQASLAASAAVAADPSVEVHVLRFVPDPLNPSALIAEGRVILRMKARKSFEKRFNAYYNLKQIEPSTHAFFRLSAKREKELGLDAAANEALVKKHPEWFTQIILPEEKPQTFGWNKPNQVLFVRPKPIG